MTSYESNHTMNLISAIPSKLSLTCRLLIYSVEMAGVCLNSLLLITLFTVTLFATTSGDPPDAANGRDRIDFSKSSLRDREDEYLIDDYFSQLHNKVWEVLASHGVQLGVNCSCNMHPKVLVLFQDFKICNAPLVPSWILAVIIGLFSGYKFYNLGPSVTGSLSYTISFVMYSFMITSGLVVHCLYLVECGAGSTNTVFADVAKIDVSLTTCIAISFLFNALIDARLVPEREYGTLILMLFSYAWVFYAYFVQLVSPQLLYFATVGVCCGLYMVFQFALTIYHHCQAIGYLISAGIVGGASLWLFRDEYCWLCQTFGAWSVEGVWYYGSDMAMLLVALYVWKTRSGQSSYSLPSETNTKHTGGPIELKKEQTRAFIV